MSYSEKLKSEIATKVETVAGEGRALRPEWIAHEICNEHKDGLARNDHADFWRHCGYRKTRQETGRYITKIYGDEIKSEEDRRQHTLPGFDYVQERYIVEREGDEIAVSPHDMTDDEIAARVKVFRSSGSTYFAHADELERFRNLRREPELAVAE